jgi:hypothetical protein
MIVLLLSLLTVNHVPADLERVLDAIALVESNGNPNAVGDGGHSLGCFQISRAYWQDGTRFLGVHWAYSQARDPAKARRVVRAYLLHFEPNGNLETWGRLHNSGPNWRKKMRLTDDYWQRLRAELERTRK